MFRSIIPFRIVRVPLAIARAKRYSWAVRPISRSPAHPDWILQPRSSEASFCWNNSVTMVKRKKQSTLAHRNPVTTTLTPVSPFNDTMPPQKRSSQRKPSKPKPEFDSSNPDRNPDIFDGPQALRASPDMDEQDKRLRIKHTGFDVGEQTKVEEYAVALNAGENSDSSLSDLSSIGSPVQARTLESKSNSKLLATKGGSGVDQMDTKSVAQAAKIQEESSKDPQFLDPEVEQEEEPGEEEIQVALSRPPPVNSDYLPLPWRGRLGYACLCTYLRFSNPPVFSSRTCRIASILENRHPLKDPNAPPHATKNRPDRDQPASIERGQAFVENLGLANARDIVKMIRWNDRYGIKFLRLSSEMFPFASHEEYGYKLAPFASEVLAEAGRVAAELGHRLTTHPGQFTQLGSPRKQVITSAIRDLGYHTELLTLLNLPPQLNRDAVMILHLGGTFGDKAAMLDRFRENYKALPQGIKDRLVLENDDVSWSVNDLLPLCEELNIPMVLDYHHNNIIFHAEKIREGTKDIMDLYPRILATWQRKNITPKMHYSEPTPAAITANQRRKHSPRVATLPPCPPTMDLMIEAKDKEQAVFELMRTFKLPGYDNFNNIIPHVRNDENKPTKTPKKKPQKKSKKASTEDGGLEIVEEATEVGENPIQVEIAEDKVGMGGPEGRVYWPPGMEEWLRPVKKAVKPRNAEESNGKAATTSTKKRKANAEATEEAMATGGLDQKKGSGTTATSAKRSKVTPKASVKKTKTRATAGSVQKFSDSDEEICQPSLGSSKGATSVPRNKSKVPRRKSARSKTINYVEDGDYC